MTPTVIQFDWIETSMLTDSYPYKWYIQAKDSLTVYDKTKTFAVFMVFRQPQMFYHWKSFPAL